jgi:hypothetical protein
VPSEGQEVQIPYKGAVADILHRIRGHLCSSVSYGGAESLESIRALVTQEPMRYLIQLGEAARRESYER